MILPLSCPILEEHYSFCFSPHNFAYEAVTPFGAAFQQLRLLVRISAPHPPRIAARLFRTLSLAFSRLTRQMPIGLFSLPLLESFNSRGSCALLRVALPSDHRLPAPTRSVSPLAAVPKSFEPSHPLNGVTYIPLSVSLQVALRPHEILPKLLEVLRASARDSRHCFGECCPLREEASVLEKIKSRLRHIVGQ